MKQHSISQHRYFWIICLILLWMLVGLGVSAAERKAIDVDSAIDESKAVVLDDGSLWIWAYNDVDFSNPKKVTDNVKQIDLGNTHGAAIKTDGSLWTWGWNYDGQLGNGSTGSGDLFYPKDTLSKIMDDVVQVSCSDFNTAAVQEDGSLWVWGRNTAGKVGNGETSQEPVTSPVKIMDGVAKVQLTGSFGVALKTDGTMWVWGDDTISENPGPMGWIEHLSPVQLMPNTLTNIKDFSMSDLYFGVIKQDGSLHTWGYNYAKGVVGYIPDEDDDYDLWNDRDVETPRFLIDNISKVYAAESASTFANMAAIDHDGTLYMWGDNSRGQLGQGDTDTDAHYEPVEVLTNVDKINVNHGFCMAIKTDGTLWTWGEISQRWAGENIIPTPTKMSLDLKETPTPSGNTPGGDGGSSKPTPTPSVPSGQPSQSVSAGGSNSNGSNSNVSTPAPAQKISIAKMKGKPKLKLKKGKIKVTFKKVTGAKGYEIRYATNKKFKKSKKVTVKSPKATLKKLKKGKKYFVKVRAYKLNSASQKVYGAYSKVVKITVR